MSTFSSDEGDADHCYETPTDERLRSRLSFCEGESLSECLSGGQTLVNERLCHGRWQWYTVDTEHAHQV